MKIKQNYVIIVYTASHQSYADSVLDYLDPNKEIIQYRLYRHNCVRVQMENEFIYVKDLRIFKNVSMKDMIIIDNSVLSFAFHLDNGIPILPYYDNNDDNELIYLQHYLNKISNSSDLREDNKRTLKMDYFLQTAKEESILLDQTEEINRSIEKEYFNNKSEENIKDKDGSLFSLNFCGNNNTSHDNSFSNDNSLNNSNIDCSHREDTQTDNNLCVSKSRFNTSKSSTFKKSNFQDQLYSTLDDLRKNFKKLSVDKKK